MTPCDASLMFGSTSPAITKKDALAIAEKLVDLFDSRGDQTKLKQMASERPLASNDVPAWDQGYQLAMEAHEVLFGEAFLASDLVDMRDIAKQLGVFLDAMVLEDDSIRAIAVAGPKHRTSILLNQSHYAHTHPVRELYVSTRVVSFAL